MKCTVLYYSASGNTQKMAEVIAEGMRQVKGVEAKAFSIEEIDAAFLNESRCVVVGTPVYLASMCHQLQTFLQTQTNQYDLKGKLCGAFATEDYIHGGGEAALQGILRHLMVKGMLAYSGGGAWGVPRIHMGPVALAGKLDNTREVFTIYGQRMADKAKELFGA